MKVIPYNKERDYDMGLDFVIDSAKNAINKKDDDFLILLVGQTGTGKSRLMKHIYHTYSNSAANVDFIGLDRKDFARALKLASTAPQPRFCCYDELDVDRRSSLTKWNREMISLYYAIRGLNIFHVWCTPSADAIDKRFITERIKGLIYVFTKHPKIRLYYYFTKEDLLRIWEKYQSLDVKLLNKVAGEYAFYRGWFRDYNGDLLKSYLDKKNARQVFKVDEFYTQWGADEDKIKRSKLRKALGISEPKFLKVEDELIEKGLIKEDETFTSATGFKFYPKQYIEYFREHIKNEHQIKKIPKDSS